MTFLQHTHNILLTRDPVDMLPSLVNQLKIPTLRDTGYKMQAQLLHERVSRHKSKISPCSIPENSSKIHAMSSQNSATL